MKEIIGVIHARGGSVRVPKKNIRLLAGKPLINWTIESALKSKCSRVIVSTDSKEIKEISLKCGADVPFTRPKDISEDVASELVTEHAVLFHEKERNTKIDIVITIQPTTPFLKSQDINQCIDLLEKNNAYDSVFTAGKVQERPEWMFFIDKETGKALNIQNKNISGNLGISQKLPELWHPNGGAYASRRDTIFIQKKLIGRNPAIVKMNFFDSIDIDEEIDFLLAEEIAKLNNII